MNGDQPPIAAIFIAFILCGLSGMALGVGLNQAYQAGSVVCPYDEVVHE